MSPRTASCQRPAPFRRLEETDYRIDRAVGTIDFVSAMMIHDSKGLTGRPRDEPGPGRW